MSHNHFTLSSRIKLEGFLDEGKSIIKCAELLEKNPSSVHGEIKRNALTLGEVRKNRVTNLGNPSRVPTPKNKYNYLGEVANRKAGKRRAEANLCHLRLTDDDTDLSITITRYLKKRWSPEQISARLRLGKLTVSGIKKKVVVAVQTIYDWIYRFRKELTKYLRHNRGYRHNRQYYINKEKRRERQLEKGIDKRPKIVDKRLRIGDFEGDTILGKDHGATGRIGTLTERKTGYLLAFLLPPLTKEQSALPEDEKELYRLTMGMRFADQAVKVLKAKLKPKYFKTLTLDNGTENNGYEWIERAISSLKVFFAHPYHSWERGTNENTNGLLRQYFPKGMDFRKITQEMLDKAVAEINNRPRKRLGWKSPQEKMWQNAALIASKKSCDLN